MIIQANLNFWRSEPITQIVDVDQKKVKTFHFIIRGTEYLMEYGSGKTVAIRKENLQKWMDQHLPSYSNQEENFKRNIEIIVSQCVENEAMIQEVVKFAQEVKDLKNKSGHLWECISRRLDEEGTEEEEEGYIYRFKLKDEYNTRTDDPNKNATNNRNLINKINQIYPAIEVNELVDNTGHLEKFGFKGEIGEQGVFIELPDYRALNNRLKKNGLGFVRIGLANGIADDESFINAHKEYDAIFSYKEEFVHDATTHVRPTIIRALQSETRFKETRESIVSLILEKMELFKKAQSLVDNNVLGLDEESVALIKKHLDKMIVTLSYLIDVKTNQFSNQKLTDFEFESQFINLWQLNNSLSDYLINRFGVEVKEQLSSILSLPLILNSLVPIDDAYKRFKKLVEDNSLAIEENEIQIVLKECKKNISFFIDHFEFFKRAPRDWAAALARSSNPSLFCEKMKLLQDIQLESYDINSIQNVERFIAFYNKYSERYTTDQIIFFSNIEQSIADFLLMSKLGDLEIKKLLENLLYYPDSLELFRELKDAIKILESKSLFKLRLNSGINNFIQITKTLSKLNLTPKQILEIQLLCKYKCGYFSEIYIALNEACDPKELAIFLGNLRDPDTFLMFAKTLKEENLTREEILFIINSCGENKIVFDGFYRIFKGKMETLEIAKKLKEFENLEVFFQFAEHFNESDIDEEKIQRIINICGENAKKFADAFDRCFREKPSPNYYDILKVLAQSNEANVGANLEAFRDYKMFPDEVSSIEKRCPDFFRFYPWFDTKPPIEDLIAAINASNDAKSLRVLIGMWGHLPLPHICKIEAECAKHGRDFLEDFIEASEAFKNAIFPTAYQDLIDALAASKDRQEYISLIGKLLIKNLPPSEILEIQNNPQANNDDFIRAFRAFLKTPSIQDLINALNQSDEKQIFRQIAQALWLYRLQPAEILEIQKRCGKNASKFPELFKQFIMPSPRELANILRKLDDRQLEDFIRLAKENKQKLSLNKLLQQFNASRLQD